MSYTAKRFIVGIICAPFLPLIILMLMFVLIGNVIMDVIEGK